MKLLSAASFILALSNTGVVKGSNIRGAAAMGKSHEESREERPVRDLMTVRK